MKHTIRWTLIATCTLLLSHAILVVPARADLLTGTYTIPPAGDSKVIPFTGGTFDANPITMGSCFPEDLLVDVTAYFTANPFVAIGLNDGMMTAHFKVNCPGLGEADFLFVAPSPNGTANVDAGHMWPDRTYGPGMLQTPATQIANERKLIPASRFWAWFKRARFRACHPRLNHARF